MDVLAKILAFIEQVKASLQYDEHLKTITQLIEQGALMDALKVNPVATTLCLIGAVGTLLRLIADVDHVHERVVGNSVPDENARVRASGENDELFQTVARLNAALNPDEPKACLDASTGLFDGELLKSIIDNLLKQVDWSTLVTLLLQALLKKSPAPTEAVQPASE